jgi:LCP family protein required for cell wall assembly
MPRHAERHHSRTAGRVVGVALVGLLAFASVGSVTALSQLQGNIDTQDIDAFLPTDRPTGTAPPADGYENRAVNILVMGSDSRGGDNAGFGSVEGMRSDTTLLVHVAADRSRVDVVSVPRDLIVEIPSCTLADGRTTAAYPLGTDETNGARFNAAFAYGGQGGDVGAAAACTIRTFEAMTDVYVDDFVVVDFSGFQKMVDAIGGVPMCFDEPIVSPQADLDLPAGCQTLDGAQALGLARARKGVSDGSDISRIDRQQELLTAMVNQVLSRDVVTNPTALLPFLGAATDSLTTSTRIGNLQTMGGLAYSMRQLDTADITFATIPFDWSGNVVLQNADGAAMWDAVRADEPLPVPDDQPEAPEDGISAGGGSSEGATTG